MFVRPSSHLVFISPSEDLRKFSHIGPSRNQGILASELIFNLILGHKDIYENALPPVAAGKNTWSILSLRTY